MFRRLVQLYVGLVLFGVAIGLMLVASVGNAPWDVLNQGLSHHTGISTGLWVDLGALCVMVFWIPLRQKPGLGTVSNALIIGPCLDITVHVCGHLHDNLPGQVALFVFAIVLNGVAGGMYIGADFGPGPRDGLMTGLSRVTGRSLRLVRTGIEATVLTSGILLGGTFGVATIAYALAIGPLVQFFLPYFDVRRERAPSAAPLPLAPLVQPASRTARSPS